MWDIMISLVAWIGYLLGLAYGDGLPQCDQAVTVVPCQLPGMVVTGADEEMDREVVRFDIWNGTRPAATVAPTTVAPTTTSTVPTTAVVEPATTSSAVPECPPLWEDGIGCRFTDQHKDSDQDDQRSWTTCLYPDGQRFRLTFDDGTVEEHAVPASHAPIVADPLICEAS